MSPTNTNKHWLDLGHVYKGGSDLVTTLPEGVPAPDGASPSAGTVLTEKLDIFSFFQLLLVSMILVHILSC